MGFLGACTKKDARRQLLSAIATTVATLSLFGCLNASEISLSQIAGTSKSSVSASATTTSTTTSGVVAIVITQQPPASASAGTAFLNGVTAELRDASNTLVATATDYTDIAIFSEATCTTVAGGTFAVGSGAGTNAVSGVASFTGLTYNSTGTIYLRVRSGSLTACSNAVTVVNGAADAFYINTSALLSNEIANQQCIGAYLETSDAFGNPYSTGAAVTANFSVAGGTGSFFSTSDPTCSSVASSSQNVSGASNFIPFKNTDSFSTYNNKSITVTASGLTTSSTTSTINVRARPSGIASGLGHTCAILSNGAVQCWGYNLDGQVGDGTTIDAAVPKQVAGLTPGTGATAIATGSAHSCAKMGISTGMVCWGENSYGQLGAGNLLAHTTPTSVTGLLAFQTINAIAAGGSHTCASTASFTYCWGGGLDGQIGNNATVDVSAPTTVSGPAGSINLAGMAALAAGYAHSCAMTASGTIYCWGKNNTGQLGVGAIAVNNMYPTPQTVSLGGIATQVVAGYEHTCALMSDQTVKCWGSNTNLQTGPSAISTCWGTNCNPIPNTISGVSNAVKIFAGWTHNCALISPSYTLKCWGYNGNGQLGNNTIGGDSNVVNVLNSSNATLDKFDFLNDGSVSTLGANHSCVARTGLVHCWGSNSLNSLGNNGATSGDVEYPVLLYKWQ